MRTFLLVLALLFLANCSKPAPKVEYDYSKQHQDAAKAVKELERSAR